MKKQKLYPSKVLRNAATGQPFMLPHGNNKQSKAIRKIARESAQKLIEALSDPTGLTPI